MRELGWGGVSDTAICSKQKQFKVTLLRSNYPFTNNHVTYIITACSNDYSKINTEIEAKHYLSLREARFNTGLGECFGMVEGAE